MSSDILIQLSQLRAMFREIHTSADDTHRMSASMRMLDQIIQSVQNDINQKTQDEE